LGQPRLTSETLVGMVGAFGARAAFGLGAGLPAEFAFALDLVLVRADLGTEKGSAGGACLRP
jgi:hypothetical protein